MIKKHLQPYVVLSSSTAAFTVCFMVWMMFAVIGIPIQNKLGLSETEFGILTALPVLSGSLIRIPLGIWTDRYGGRVVFATLMFTCVLPLYLLQYATLYWQFLVIGLCIGLAGGSFSVGTPYVARWFQRDRQGLAMGVFGAGNAGAAVNKLIAPTIVAVWGWQAVSVTYAFILLITALLFSFFSYSKQEHIVPTSISLKQQLAMIKDPNVIRYSLYYAVVFGGYVALSLWMVHYYVNAYGFDLRQAAFLAACFSLPGGLLRAWGGWLSDRYGAYKVTWYVMWGCLISFLLLSLPQVEVSFQVLGMQNTWVVNIGVNSVWFTVLLFFAGISMAVGKASVFKFISDKYPADIGTISGMVGLAGGLGGFVLPIVFGLLVDMTGIYSTSFMVLCVLVTVCLCWMRFSVEDRQKAVVLDPYLLVN